MKLPKIYVAAPWADRELAKEAKLKLEADGFEVTSRWIEKHLPKPSDQSGLGYDRVILIQEAGHDVEDVFNADIVILLNTQKRGEETSGKAVETGMAMAWMKPVIVVGEISNIFHYLMPVVTTLDEAVALIQSWMDRKPVLDTPKDAGKIIITG